jgi:hypothetical protein
MEAMAAAVAAAVAAAAIAPDKRKEESLSS